MTAKGGPGQDPNQSGRNTHRRGDTLTMQGSRSLEIRLGRDLARSARPIPHLRPRSARRGLWERRLHGSGHRAGCSLPVGSHGRPVHTSPQRPHFAHLRRRLPPASNAASLEEAPPGSAPSQPEIEPRRCRSAFGRSPEVPPVARAQLRRLRRALPLAR